MKRRKREPNKGSFQVKMSNEERFWSYVEKKEDCWEWKGGKDTRGYGQFHLNIDGKFKNFRASRYVYMLSTGRQLDSNTYVCHTCDNPSCVNPAHLWGGTHQDNMNDRKRKNRNIAPRNQGENSPRAKLNWKQVLEIREIIKDKIKKMTHQEIAEKFGVSRGLVRAVIYKQSWNYKTNPTR